MHRIDNATAAASLPTPAAAGSPGYFTNGNPGSGTPATVLDDDWMNAVQEEIVAVVMEDGGTLDKTSRTQLRDKLRSKYGGGRLISSQKVTATTTLTVPANATKARVRMLGAVGGGGGSDATGVGSPAGGAGYGEGDYAVTGGASLVATIGAAGSAGGGGVSPTNGTAGGTTSLGSLMSITGSGAGLAGSGAIQASVGAGGAVTGATLRSATGQSGGIGYGLGGSTYMLGQPGGCWGGLPPQPIVAGIAVAGQAGQLGMGGGGGALSGGGGVGFRGEILIDWYT